MENLIADIIVISKALFSNDAWQISDAFNRSGIWPLGLVLMLLAALLMLLVYRIFPGVERRLERGVMVTSYLVIAAIIFVEVFRRFLLNEQVPWSTTLPPFLFLIMTWFGCSYNVKLRTHLAFNEFRSKLPRNAQMATLVMDTVLWLGFSWVVVVTSARVTANSAANFQILLGTDNILQWWFLIAVPISFTLLATRALENLFTDINNFNSGQPLLYRNIIGGE